jgi:pyruvate/2-oxoglutarate dehydrogenase complex dihydrolipoamide dehydrogenase (E3) component
VIVGASATGCQLASIFNAFGTDVTLLELAPRVIPGEDETISRAVAAAFKRRGIEVVIGMDGISRIEQRDQGVRVVYKHEDQEHHRDTDVVIMAVGWPGNADRLNLEAAGVTSERNYIVVDDTLRTSQPHIFAAGDITARMMLVQGATDEALIAAQNAVLGRKRIHEHRVVPHGGFTDPEYGSVGMTEAKAREQHEVVVATVPYADLDRAVIDGRPEGFCKLIVSRETHQILGAHVVGEQAVELVHIVAANMETHSTIVRLAQLEIAYPTFAAVVGLAARKILRQLGSVPSSSNWGTFSEPLAAEWERS